MRTVRLPYGKEFVSLHLPDRSAVLSPSAGPSEKLDVRNIRDALNAPIASPPLIELLRRTRPRTVAITISDITRAVPNRLFMQEILRILESAGISDDAVTIIVGTGMHRPSTFEEHEELLGGKVLRRYRVVDHCADDAPSLMQVSHEPYVAVNRLFAEADFRIVTGFIEPHFMAGYSGGRKGVCPALVDLETIQRFHGYETLADPRAKEGVLDGNPCHEIALEVARRVGVDFLFNVAINREKEIVGIYCGDPEEAHARGCRDVAHWTSVTLGKQYDIVLTSGGGYPLDQNFYQTVKGMCLALPALQEGGTLLIVSSCREQLGSPEYTELMKRYAGRWREFLTDISSNPEQTVKDQWELQLQCRVLQRVGVEGVLFFSDEMDPALQRKVNVTPILGREPVERRLQRTVDELLEENPNASVAVIPEGPYTMLLDNADGGERPVRTGRTSSPCK